jgi:hypothetical protein
MGANAAAFAVIQVRGKEAINLVYASLRAIDLA